MSVTEFIGKVKGGEGVEGEIAQTIFISLATSFILVILLYVTTLKNIDNFIPKYGFFLFLAIISYSLILPSVRQIRAFKQFPCMTGMMIGMTIGMISGFLAGFFVGATNGMFWGSIFGMAVGIVFGVWNGKCCGVMGVMEGMMAGFMGGLMGAMTAVMMINDHLKVAAVIMFIICAAILLGLSYMIYTETKHEERTHTEDQSLNIIISIVLTVTTTWMMIYGPKSPLFA